MIQFIQVPVNHIQIGDKVLNTITRKCEIVKEIERLEEEYWVTYEDGKHTGWLNDHELLWVAIDIELALEESMKIKNV